MGPSDKVSQTKYDGIIIQSSLMGTSIPRGWGTNKLGCNLIDYLDFTAKKQSSGGKGGGDQASYDYKATLVMAICQGPIAGVRTIYKDSAVFTAQGGGSKEVNGTTVTISPKTPIAAAGLTGIYLGPLQQTPWPYLTSNHPGHDLGYPGLAYCVAENYDLNSSATTPNHNFEAQFAVRAMVNGAVIDDADAGAILADVLSAAPQFPTSAFSAQNLRGISDYCFGQGLFISPIADDGRQASDLITEVMKASNLDCFYADGMLQFTPYGDTVLARNGVTWTPDLTPRYALSWDDILPNSSGEDPIQWDSNRTLDAYNYQQLGFLDRTMQYAENVVTAVDQANIDLYGRRPADKTSMDCICDGAVAATLAQLMVQRSANVRRTCEFKLSELFGLLNPMEDLVTVPLRNGASRLVRIVEVNEGEDGTIDVKAEEELVSVSHAAEYARQDALGTQSDSAVDPGDSNPPTIINPPLSLTAGALEVWLATSGGPNWGGCNIWSSVDGEEYQLVGKITQPGRYGVTTTDLPVAADPDTTSSLGVDLSASGGALTAASDGAADAGATLCAIGTEIVGFSAVTQTASSAFTLNGYLRRGQAGTTIADQPAGSLFLRLDEAVGVVPYTSGAVGKPVYIKLQSVNLYGAAAQDLDLCTAYEFTAEQNGSNVGDIDWTSITNVPTVITDYITSGGTANNTLAILDQEAADVLADIDAAAAQAAAALDYADTGALAILQLGQAAQDLKSYVKALAYVNGQPTGQLLQHVQSVADDSAESLDLIGYRSSDNTAFVLSDTTIQYGSGQSLAAYNQAISASLASNTALINTNATSTASQFAAQATLNTTLQASLNSNTAAINANYTTLSTSISTETSARLTLASNFNSFQSSANSTLNTLTTASQSYAGSISTLQSNYGSLNSTVTTQAGTLATATGQLYGSLLFNVNAGGTVTSLQLASASGPRAVSVIKLTASNIILDGNAIVTGSLQTLGIANNAVTNTVALTGAANVNGAYPALTPLTTQNITMNGSGWVTIYGQCTFTDGGGNPANYHSSSVGATINNTATPTNSVISNPNAIGTLTCIGAVYVNISAPANIPVVFNASTKSNDSITAWTFIIQWFYR